MYFSFLIHSKFKLNLKIFFFGQMILKNMKKNIKLTKYIYFFLFSCYLIFFNNKLYLKNNIMKNNPIDINLYDKKFKELLLGLISQSLGQKIYSVKSIFLSHNVFFGNQIQILNNIIFIC